MLLYSVSMHCLQVLFNPAGKEHALHNSKSQSTHFVKGSSLSHSTHFWTFLLLFEWDTEVLGFLFPVLMEMLGTVDDDKCFVVSERHTTTLIGNCFLWRGWQTTYGIKRNLFSCTYFITASIFFWNKFFMYSIPLLLSSLKNVKNVLHKVLNKNSRLYKLHTRFWMKS